MLDETKWRRIIYSTVPKRSEKKIPPNEQKRSAKWTVGQKHEFVLHSNMLKTECKMEITKIIVIVLIKVDNRIYYVK